MVCLQDLLISGYSEHAHSIFVALSLSREPVHYVFRTWTGLVNCYNILRSQVEAKFSQVRQNFLKWGQICCNVICTVYPEVVALAPKPFLEMYWLQQFWLSWWWWWWWQWQWWWQYGRVWSCLCPSTPECDDDDDQIDDDDLTDIVYGAKKSLLVTVLHLCTFIWLLRRACARRMIQICTF